MKPEKLKERILKREAELNANREWRVWLPLEEAVREYVKALPLIEEQMRDIALYRKLAGLPKYARLDFLEV